MKNKIKQLVKSSTSITDSVIEDYCANDQKINANDYSKITVVYLKIPKEI